MLFYYSKLSRIMDSDNKTMFFSAMNVEIADISTCYVCSCVFKLRRR